MPGPEEKSFAIPKLMVWEAWRQVKANKGAPGVDGQDLEEFEADLRDNLYKVWNRMSSGSYFPPPVRAVEIPKPHGDGVRVLGVPTVADRVAQTVLAMYLEPMVEPRFHQDSLSLASSRWCLPSTSVLRDTPRLTASCSRQVRDGLCSSATWRGLSAKRRGEPWTPKEIRRS